MPFVTIEPNEESSGYSSGDITTPVDIDLDPASARSVASNFLIFVEGSSGVTVTLFGADVKSGINDLILSIYAEVILSGANIVSSANDLIISNSVDQVLEPLSIESSANVYGFANTVTLESVDAQGSANDFTVLFQDPNSSTFNLEQVNSQDLESLEFNLTQTRPLEVE